MTNKLVCRERECQEPRRAMESDRSEFVELPPLRNFVLPGGSRISSRAQICRTVARRCERRVVTLANEHDVDQNVLTYLNRLSDYFFVLARFNNIHNQIEEIFWDKDCK